MTLTEALYGVIFTPVKTLREISENRIWLTGILVFFIVMAFSMTINLSMTEIQPVEEILPIAANFIWIGGIIGIIFSIFMLFIMSGLYSLLGEIIYKSGNGVGLLASLSFASLPAIFVAPVQYIATLINLNFMAIIISPIIGIWVLVLQVISIRESMGLSTSQAVVLFIIPIVTLILIGGVILVIAASTLLAYK